MAELEVLISELFTVDRLSTSTIATSEVTTLEHELRNDTVERRALVGQDLAGLICVSLTELGEVLGSLRDNIIVELEVDTTLLSFTSRAVLDDEISRRHSCRRLMLSLRA